MKMKEKLTDTRIKTFKPESSDEVLWDETDAGFGVRYVNGAPSSYISKFSIAGRQGKVSLGKVSQISLKKARLKAQHHNGQVADKTDPRTARRRAASDIRSARTMASLIDDFEAHMRHKNRSPGHIARTKQFLADYFKALHAYPLREIDKAAVAEELRKIKKERGAISMTRARAGLHAFFTWAMGEDFAQLNPVSGTVKYEAEVREHVIEPEELAAIWKALPEGDYGDIVKLLLLTGLRREQVGGLRKSEVDLDKGEIKLPGKAGRSKNRKPFVIPLSKQAVAILERRAPRRDSEYVFGEGEAGFSGWSNCKERLDKKLGDAVEPWQLHDFRRSLNTLGQSKCKLQPHILDACLSHVAFIQSGVRKHYNLYSYADEKRDALQCWADYLDSVIWPKPRLVGTA
jgi:integrase